MAKQNPNDFFAFLSVGTVADMAAGDELRYQFLKASAKKSRDQKDLSDLELLGPPPWKEFSQLVINSRLMTKYKGSFYALNGDQVSAAVKQNKEYTSSEMENLDVSMEKIWHRIFPFLSKYKALDFIPKLNLPVIFVHGAHDMATPKSLAKKYFEAVNAPQGKRWIEFTNSAHFPMYEEPEKFRMILKEDLSL